MKFIASLKGNPDVTTRVAVTDVVQYFAAAIYSKDNHPAVSALITCEENAIRFAFGTDPTQGVGAVGHILYAGQAIQLSNSYAIRQFRFINETAQTDAVLQITAEFEIGG